MELDDLDFRFSDHLPGMDDATYGREHFANIVTKGEGKGSYKDAIRALEGADGVHGNNPSPLPMDEASRMQRARDMGFDVDAYHGTAGNIVEFEGPTYLEPLDSGLPPGTVASDYALPGSGDWIDPGLDPSDVDFDADLAAELTKLQSSAKAGAAGGPNVMPLKTRGNILDLSTDGDRAEKLKSIGVSQETIDSAGDLTGIQSYELFDDEQLIGELKALGYDGVKFSDDWVEGYPHNSLLIFDPANIRSKFAKFDPAKRNSRNILAGLAPIGIGGPLAAGLYQPESGNPLLP